MVCIVFNSISVGNDTNDGETIKDWMTRNIVDEDIKKISKQVENKNTKHSTKSKTKTKKKKKEI